MCCHLSGFAELAETNDPEEVIGVLHDYHAAADGWTLRTNDGSRAAHVEHTVAITEDGLRILTAREAL